MSPQINRIHRKKNKHEKKVTLSSLLLIKSIFLVVFFNSRNLIVLPKFNEIYSRVFQQKVILFSFKRIFEKSLNNGIFQHDLQYHKPTLNLLCKVTLWADTQSPFTRCCVASCQEGRGAPRLQLKVSDFIFTMSTKQVSLFIFLFHTWSKHVLLTYGTLKTKFYISSRALHSFFNS